MTKTSALAERPDTRAARSGPPQEPQRFEDERPRRRLALFVSMVGCLAVAVLGATQLAGMLREGQTPEATTTATMSGVRLDIAKVEWVTFDQHVSGGGFAMPAGMTPDMPPDGYGRLALDVNFQNVDGEAARALDPTAEFFLGGGRIGTEPIALQAETLGQLDRLNPGQAVTVSMYYDLLPSDEGDPSLWLEWRRGGDSTRILLVPGGEPSAGQHAGH